MMLQAPRTRKRASQRAGRSSARLHISPAAWKTRSRAPRRRARPAGAGGSGGAGCGEGRSEGTVARGRSGAAVGVVAARLAELPRLVVAVVGGDDLLHQRVADDVALVEAEELDAADLGEHLLRLAQARGAPLRQVDLGDVAVDHR